VNFTYLYEEISTSIHSAFHITFMKRSNSEIAQVHLCDIKQIKSFHFYLQLHSIKQQDEKHEKNNPL